MCCYDYTNCEYDENNENCTNENCTNENNEYYSCKGFYAEYNKILDQMMWCDECKKLVASDEVEDCLADQQSGDQQFGESVE